MLDTAMIMMQQYNTAAALSIPMPNLSQNASNLTETSNPGGGFEEAATKPTAESTSKINKTENLVEDASTSTSDTTPLTPEEEIRRRRLQRFQVETPQEQ